MNLTGRWIGETQGAKTRRHFWVIRQKGKRLEIYTCWEGEKQVADFKASIINPSNFIVESYPTSNEVLIISSESFLISKWVWSEEDGKLIPKFDVLFYKRNERGKEILYSFLLTVLIPFRSMIQSIGFRDPLLLFMPKLN